MADTLSASKHPGIVRWAVIFGTAIILNLFLVYATEVFYPKPLYEDFCKEEQVKRAYPTEEACVSVGGQWTAPGPLSDGPEQKVSEGYCYADFTCNKDFQVKQSLYQRDVFIILVVIGLLLILGASFIKGTAVLSAGLSFGGVLSLIIGSLMYWSNMDDRLRVVVLGIALASLIFLAWKKFKD